MKSRANGAERRGPAALGLCAALALGAGLMALPAQAQTVYPPPPAPAPGSCTGHLNDSCLYAMLQQMGLEPRPLSKGFLVAKKEGKWTNNIQVVISPNGVKLGLNANLGRVTESEVTGEQWKALLISNGDIDPNNFYYDPQQGKLYLHRAFDNRGVTPASLLYDLQSFSDTIISTEALWKFTH